MKSILIKTLGSSMLITASVMALAATWTADPYYFIRQTSTAGSSRYAVTKLPVGSDTSTAAPIAKSETTLITTWTTTPYYLIRERSDGGSTRHTATDRSVNFINEMPAGYGCKFDEAVIFDPAFGGIKLDMQPTFTNPSPCMCIKLTKQPSGKYSWAQYGCDTAQGTCR